MKKFETAVSFANVAVGLSTNAFGVDHPLTQKGLSLLAIAQKGVEEAKSTDSRCIIS